MHYNSCVAIVFAVVVGVLTLFAQAMGYLPLPTICYVKMKCIWCQIFGMAALLLGLCFAADVAVLLGRRGNVGMFLDRTCVCQTDMDLKRQGIESLAALLNRSCSLLVLYSDIYLQKLWTVYELATYLMLYPRGDLVFRPVFFPQVVLWGMAMVGFSRITFEIYGLDFVHQRLHHAGVSAWVLNDWLWPLMTLPSIFVMTAMMRRWAEEQEKTRERLSSFSIRNATCLSEDDRHVIERNITVYAKHVCMIEYSGTREDALDAFDSMIRRELRRFFSRRVGRTGIPYRYVLMMYIVYLFYALDVCASSMIHQRIPPMEMLCTTIYCATVVFATGPITVAYCFKLSQALIGLHTLLANTLVGIVTFAIYCGLLALTWELCERAAGKPQYLAALLGTCTALLIVTSFVYRPIGSGDPHCWESPIDSESDRADINESRSTTEISESGSDLDHSADDPE